MVAAGRASPLAVFLTALATLGAALLAPAGQAAASEIRYIVNNTAITTYDIERRAAFLKLQRRPPAQAAEDLIDQTLRTQEMQRLRIAITDNAVDAAYERFAKSNKMTLAQLDGIMSQSGVTKQHFKEYIRAQMGWGQALSSRARTKGRLSEQEVVQRMLQQGGSKPTATEYMLQQVIFVVPAAQRGALLGQRKREADALRGRFQGCESTREFAKGLVDVTVRDLGRVLAPELPPDWAEAIKSTRQGAATAARETDRGVEFIGVCSAREVSDDRVAQMVFQSEDTKGDKAADDLSKQYTDELRKRAKIIKR